MRCRCRLTGRRAGFAFSSDAGNGRDSGTRPVCRAHQQWILRRLPTTADKLAGAICIVCSGSRFRNSKRSPSGIGRPLSDASIAADVLLQRNAVWQTALGSCSVKWVRRRTRRAVSISVRHRPDLQHQPCSRRMRKSSTPWMIGWPPARARAESGALRKAHRGTKFPC